MQCIQHAHHDHPYHRHQIYFQTNPSRLGIPRLSTSSPKGTKTQIYLECPFLVLINFKSVILAEEETEEKCFESRCSSMYLGRFFTKILELELVGILEFMAAAVGSAGSEEKSLVSLS